MLLDGPLSGGMATTSSEETRITRRWPFSVLQSVIGRSDSDLMAPDFESNRRQELLFAVLNEILIGALLALQTFSRIVRGRPAISVIVVLAAGLTVESIHVAWLHYRRTEPVPSPDPRTFSYWSIFFNSGLALLLTSLTIRGDTAYYALMLLPVLEAAFRLEFRGMITVVMLADLISFMGAWGLKFGEYIEAGAMSVIFTVMGMLVWLLVRNLRERELKFARNLEELEHTRHQLLSEEKLAAVGRLSRALAHEIRNPVAMISSSLATAMRTGQDESERTEMFAIAAKEAARLERLTTDFLIYARPRAPQMARSNLADLLNYTGTVARAHAARKGVTIDVAAENNLEADFDPSQIQQALLNLLINAVEACGRGDAVWLQAEKNAGRNAIRIDVTDSAGAIPEESVNRIFEPLFTTKQGGNGLGLAIARTIVRAHGGEIILRANEPGRVCFSIELPADNTPG